MTTDANDKMEPPEDEYVTVWYVAEERAMAPGIAGGYSAWPKVVRPSGMANGRLVKMPREHEAELAELRQYKAAYREAMNHLLWLLGRGELPTTDIDAFVAGEKLAERWS